MDDRISNGHVTAFAGSNCEASSTLKDFDGPPHKSCRNKFRDKMMSIKYKEGDDKKNCSFESACLFLH